MDERLVLTKEEAEELWKFFRCSYLNPNANPALVRLTQRLSVWPSKDLTVSCLKS